METKKEIIFGQNWEPVVLFSVCCYLKCARREGLRTPEVCVPKAGRSFLLLGRAQPGPCVCHQLTEGKMMERRKKIALELSELVVYCRPVPFDEESKAGARCGVHVLRGWWLESGL